MNRAESTDAGEAPASHAPSPSTTRRTLLIVLAIAGLAAASWWAIQLSRPVDPDSAERLGSQVEMLCRESGKRFTVTRGLVEAELRGRAGQLSESAGVASPFADQRPVARIASDADWRETIERINREKRETGRRP